MRKNLCEYAVSGPLFTAINAEKRQFGETVDAEINVVIYMELNSGAKMVDDKYRKTYVAGSVDRENAVFI
jgi:cytidine deaminase